VRFISLAFLLLLSGVATAETYQLTSDALAPDQQTIIRQSDRAFIPPDPKNGDFAAYLNWIAKNKPDAAPRPAAVTTVTRAEFLALFTSPELLNIATAAQTTPSINVWLIKAQAANQIDLAAARTKAGLDALVAAGILTSARETEILSNKAPL
jgi:hypothetical protein